MEKTLYLAGLAQTDAAQPFVQFGFGFAENGAFFAPEAVCGLPVLDDRYLPSEAGVREAAAFFSALDSDRLLCDFERPASPLLASLVEKLDAQRLIVPPQYAHLPHAAVFVPPYQPTRPFAQWLEKMRRRYGEIVLDMQPICPQESDLSGHFSEALCCMYRAEYRHGKPTFTLFDTVETYLRRAESANAPCIVLQTEFAALENTDCHTGDIGHRFAMTEYAGDS